MKDTKAKGISAVLKGHADFGAPYVKLVCPRCGDDYIHTQDVESVPSDNYEAWAGRGSLDLIHFWGECGHKWSLAIGFHKGQSYIFIRSDWVDYHAYINSPEWKEKAAAAKERAGQRCQVCNVSGSVKTLNAHHRTYEHLGDERPDEITVLCRDCHFLFESNGKVVKPEAVEHV